MAHQRLTVAIVGLSPLLQHNGQLADPINKFVKAMKAITGKKKKTEEDHAELARLEWNGSLYVDNEGNLILPSSLIEASIHEGAKKSKLGKTFKSSVFVNDDAIVDFGSKKKIVDLWGDDQYRDTRGVRVGMSRVMRTRPIFRNWKCTFEVMYDDEQVNLDDVKRAIQDAASKVGVGDFRPKFGRFEVVSMKAG